PPAPLPRQRTRPRRPSLRGAPVERTCRRAPHAWPAVPEPPERGRAPRSGRPSRRGSRTVLRAVVAARVETAAAGLVVVLDVIPVGIDPGLLAGGRLCGCVVVGVGRRRLVLTALLARARVLRALAQDDPPRVLPRGGVRAGHMLPLRRRALAGRAAACQ